MVDEKKLNSGAFYFDRREAPKHISMAWTEYPKEKARAPKAPKAGQSGAERGSGGPPASVQRFVHRDS